MKFLFALFAATVATAAADGVTTAGTAADLASRWDMDDKPDVTYDSATNKFTIDYLGASGFGEYQEEFYDVNCKDDGSGFPENVVRAYFTDAINGGRPQMYKNTDTGRPELSFIIDTQEAAADENIYEVVGANPDTCMGQYYDVTASISLTVDSDVIEVEGGTFFGWGFNIKRRADGEYMTIDDNLVTQFDESNLVGTVIKEVTGLCRDTDYDFELFSADGDEPNDLPMVTITYDSSGTPDTLFTITEDEMELYATEEDGTSVIWGKEVFSLPENPQNPATNLDGKDGLGMMKFCVRGGIGYNENDADDDLLADPETPLADALANGYQEVNFIESLITIFYNLTAGFEVDDFNVDPKERVETTAAKEAYGLEAWLCVSGSDAADLKTETWGRIAPNKISDNYLVTATEKEYFNQGALITVCVAPVESAFTDGIRMDGITNFEWKRDDFGDVFDADSTLPTDAITQPAIVDGEASGNLLTSYLKSACENGPDYCRFSSILFADFYITTGAVSGSGNAKLVFGSRRRLGESLSRQLQADEGGDSPFDLQVPVDITDTGPAGLKTAGGVSFAASTFTMAVALIGAALLA